jgi:hypothetical protein
MFVLTPTTGVKKEREPSETDSTAGEDVRGMHLRAQEIDDALKE